jgi:hypothetical protein
MASKAVIMQMKRASFDDLNGPGSYRATSTGQVDGPTSSGAMPSGLTGLLCDLGGTVPGLSENKIA